MDKRRFLFSSIALLAAKIFFPFRSQAMKKTTQESNWSTINVADVDQQRIEKGGPYLSFINRDSLKTGLYVLPKGSEDKQKPHELDEVYYIVEGVSKFFVDGETIGVRPGDVIYVKAEKEHRFVEIEQDLKILVFFSEFRA